MKKNIKINTVGFIGLGVMGMSMFKNLAKFKELTLQGFDNDNTKLKDTYLDRDNLNYRIAGKLMVLSPQKDDLFWMSIRTSFGRNDSSNQGYLFSELINTFKLNDKVFLNLTPTYFFSGVKSFGGLGVSTYINLFDNFQLIPEINTSFRNYSDFNSTLALRYTFQEDKSIDLYYSNAIGIQDIGKLLSDDNHRFGIKLNILY